MCGIFGIYFFDSNRKVEENLLKRMGDTIVNRGPNDHGYYTRQNIGLGMRRLSIIDVAGGKQPVVNESQNIHAVMNGEIYNYQELKSQWLKDGHVFRSNSDAEVIPHMYEELGEHYVEKLNGMFAISLWDSNRKKLLLYRDRLGIKPLYYYQDNEKLIWASELKAILATGLVTREINPQAVELYFRYGYVPAPFAIFKNIKKLLPGHCLKIENNQVDIHPYWELNPSPFKGSIREAEEELSHLLTQAVKYRLISDVPLGAFLSGGLDSSLIVALMRQVMDQPAKTFSVKFQEKAFDESAFAQKVSNHLGTSHHPFEVRPMPMDIVDTILPYFDEPFADQSSIPAYYVSQQARQHVIVALSGDGGDELFGGYKKYRTLKSAAIYNRLDPFSTVVSKIGKMIPGKIGRRSRNFALYGQMKPEDRFMQLSTVLGDKIVRDLTQELPGSISDDTTHLRQLIRPIQFKGMTMAEEMNRWFHLDTQSYLVDDVLTKVDRMSMLHSLEVRVPLLDHKVVEFAHSLPAHFKMHYFQGKQILKNIARTVLPHDIVYRPKHAWMVPVANWLKGELKPTFMDIMADKNRLPSDLLDFSKIQHLAKEHFEEKKNHATALWNVLAFMVWFRNWGRES
jgi:asparagine synthase (glutamine-hydrolysing)